MDNRILAGLLAGVALALVYGLITRIISNYRQRQRRAVIEARLRED